MFAALLLLQGSLLVAPLELADKPPETRAVAEAVFDYSDDAWHQAIDWTAKAQSAEGFISFVRANMAKPTLELRTRFGTFPRSMLYQRTGDFLFTADVGSVIDVQAQLEFAPPYFVAQRLERDAACRQIFVAGTDDRARANADGILRALRAGADFAALARERSDDRASALRGGDFAIFERGPNDALLREAAFNMKVGEISSVIPSPLGFHILQRVEVSALDPRLRDDVWAHARGILIAFDGARGSDPALKRDHDQAEQIANDLATRIRRGEDMGALAKEFNEDGRGEHGGRARAGDLGWVRRGTTAMPQFMDRLFTDVPDTLIGPIATEAGYVLVRREDPGLRSRIDLRKSAFVDFEQWVRCGSQGRRDEWTAAATHRAQAIGDAFSWSLGDVSLTGILARCSSVSDFEAQCGSLPETARRADGKELMLRLLAHEYAIELAKIESKFLAEYWPQHEHAIDQVLVPLRQQLLVLGDSALDEIMKDLEMRDPRTLVPIFIVARASADAQVVKARDGQSVCIVTTDHLSGLDQLQFVFRWAAGALDLATLGQPTLLSALRERLALPDPSQSLESNALVSAECEGVVQRVFDARLKFVARRFAAGWTCLRDASMGGGAADLDTTSERGQRIAPVFETWRAHLAGKLTRDEALDAIVATAKAAK